MNSKLKFDRNPHRCAVSSSADSHLRTPFQTTVQVTERIKSWTMVNVPKIGMTNLDRGPVALAKFGR